MGIDYEVVNGPLRRGKRDELERISGQLKYPVIEFDDGSAYRADSNDMAERIRAGNVFEGREGPTARPALDQKAARPSGHSPLPRLPTRSKQLFLASNASGQGVGAVFCAVLPEPAMPHTSHEGEFG